MNKAAINFIVTPLFCWWTFCYPQPKQPPANNVTIEMKKRQDRTLSQSPHIPDMIKNPIGALEIYVVREANKQARKYKTRNNYKSNR